MTLEEWIEAAIKSGRLYLDTETHYHKDRPNNPELHGYCYAIGFGCDNLDVPILIWHELRDAKALPRTHVRDVLLRIISKVPTTFHNTLFDLQVLERNFGIQYSDYQRLDDTMLVHGLLWSECPHRLDFVNSTEGTLNKLKHLDTSSIPYLMGDIRGTVDAWQRLERKMDKDPLTARVYEEIQRPLIPAVHKAHMRGLRINQPYLQEMKPILEQQRDAAIATAQTYCGFEINLASSPQVRDWVFEHERLHMSVKPGARMETLLAGLTRKKGTGNWSLQKDQLAIIQGEFLPVDPPDVIAENPEACTMEGRIERGGHPFLEALAAYNQCASLISNFIKKLEGKERAYPEMGIHSQATGRWSNKNPPMSGLPKRFKKLFIPDMGHGWSHGDYTNIELQLFANVIEDDVWLTGFKRGDDLHSVHACQSFGWGTFDKRVAWTQRKVKGYQPINLVTPCEHFAWAFNEPDLEGAGHGWTWKKWKKDRVELGCPECWNNWVHLGGPPPGWLADDDPFRKFNKSLVFRLCYGGQVSTSHTIPGAMTLGLKKAEIHAASQALIDAHPGMGKYWEGTDKAARGTRVVRTFMGRGRFLMADNVQERERAASNHPIQGGAAEFLNTTVAKTEQRAPWSYLTYTVHDYLGRGAPIHMLDELDQVMKEEAERPRRLTTVYGNEVDVVVPFAMDGRIVGDDFQW